MDTQLYTIIYPRITTTPTMPIIHFVFVVTILIMEGWRTCGHGLQTAIDRCEIHDTYIYTSHPKCDKIIY